MDALIIFMAEYLPWAAGIAIFLFLVFVREKKKEFRMLIVAFLAVILSRFGFTEIIRYFYDRPRPFEVAEGLKTLLEHSSGGSFPSGHAAFFFALAMGVFFYRRIWGLVFFAAALSIGFGRVAAGLHWPSDILGGAVVGIFSAVLIKFFLRKYNNRG